MIERFKKQQQLNKVEAKKEHGFFPSMKRALSHRDLIAFILLLFLYQSGTMCMTSSIHYVGNYILNVLVVDNNNLCGDVDWDLLSIPSGRSSLKN